MNNLLRQAHTIGVDIDREWVSQQKPRAHGNGFLQFNITPRARIHIWDRRLPNVRPDSQIHNHRRGFISHILAGEIINKVYSAFPEKDGEYIAYKGDHEKHQLIEKDGRYGLELKRSNRFGSGSRYRMAREELHESIAVYCCTLMIQENLPPANDTWIFSTKPVPEESRTYDRHGDKEFQELLWQILRDANEFLYEARGF